MNKGILRSKKSDVEKSERYLYRFTVRSASSDRLYLISYDNAPNANYWTCSCRGNIAHGQCKHLTAAGLQGRKFGKSIVNMKKVLELTNG
jgi:hypothetical protein